MHCDSRVKYPKDSQLIVFKKFVAYCLILMKWALIKNTNAAQSLTVIQNKVIDRSAIQNQ